MIKNRIGSHIILRKAKLTDAESMLKHVWADKRVYENMLYTPTLTLPDAVERCKRSIRFQEEHYAYFIALKDTDEAIGLCAINEYEPHKFEECGICIGVAHQGKGYGKEVLSLLLDLTFNELNGVLFKYGYFIENEKSKNLSKSFGFEYLETKEIIRPWDKKEKTIEYCTLSVEKYKNKKVGR